MADGIKIRSLLSTDSVGSGDVFIIDRDGTPNSVTYNIKSEDVFSSIDIGQLSDVVADSPSVNDALVYDGDKWVSQPVQVGGDTVGGDVSTQDFVLLKGGNTITTFVVTVGDKTASNHSYGFGSSKCYYINGVEMPDLILSSNRVYRFDQSDPSNTGYRMALYFNYERGSRTREEDFGVVQVGTAGVDGYLELKFASLYDTSLGEVTMQSEEKYYYDLGKDIGLRQYMGNSITLPTSDAVNFYNFSLLRDSVEALQAQVESLLS